MKSFLGRSSGSSRWGLAVAAGVAVALLVVGAAIGAYFAGEAVDDTSLAQEPEQPTATAPAADSSPTPAVTPEPTAPLSVTPEPSPQPTARATKGGPGLGPGQLDVSAADVRPGADAKYYIPDRGDGCEYKEIGRSSLPGPQQKVVLMAVGCNASWVYTPARGELEMASSLHPRESIIEVRRAEQMAVTAQDVKQDADGKYYIPDRGDGCEYREQLRFSSQGKDWVLLGDPNCEFFVHYAPDTGELLTLIS